MASVGLGSELVSRLKILAQKSGTTLLAGFVTLLGDFLRKTYGKQEILIGVPVGLRETQDEFNAAGFFVNTIALRLQARGELDIVSATRETATQLKEAIAHNRYCNRTAVADILATHSCVENIEEEGLSVEILEPQLKASKFTASFTLETGAKARIVLEYDELFIKNGSSLLEDFKQFIENECVGIPQRNSVQIFADAWQVILHSEANEQSDFLRDGGDSIKAIQITGVLHRNHVKVLSAADFIRTPGFGDLCRLLDKAEDFHAGGEPSYASVEAGQKVPLLPLQEALIQNHPDHWKDFYMLLPMEISSGIEQDRIESWLQTLPGRFEALRLSFAKEGAPFLYAPEKITLKSCFIESGISRTELFRNMFKVVIAGLNLETGQTFGAGLAEQEGRQFLVFAGHHLVLDALSLDILRQDLIHFCRNTGELCETYGVATRAVEVEKMVEDGLFPTQEDYRFWE